MKNIWLSVFLLALIGWQLNIAFVSDSKAMQRGVASSGSVPSATCANNGGVIYGAAGAFTCNSLFTTDGLGNVSQGGAVSVGSLVANTNGIGAAVGQVGYVTSGAVLTAAAVTLSTGTVTSGANVGVPAGDFDITVTGCFTPSGTTTLNLITLGINNSNAQPAVDLGGFTQYNQAATSVPTANDICMQTTRRVLTTSATNYYAIATAVFATSTLKFHSYISARQMR